MRAREDVAKVLSTHDILTDVLICRRCQRTYSAIVKLMVECDAPRTEAPQLAHGPGHGRGVGQRYSSDAELSGYRDPRRPNWAWLRLVCEPELRESLVQIAREENVNLSEIVRRACRTYVENR